jgi:hypothetical protein
MKVPEKKRYMTPRLIAYGSIATITQGNLDGDFTDAAFPINTPKRDLTFS